jgi:hypothetical protein
VERRLHGSRADAMAVGDCDGGLLVHSMELTIISAVSNAQANRWASGRRTGAPKRSGQPKNTNFSY